MSNFAKRLEELHNKDETSLLETKQESWEGVRKMADARSRELIYEEFNQLSKEIAESNEREKKYT